MVWKFKNVQNAISLKFRQHFYSETSKTNRFTSIYNKPSFVSQKMKITWRLTFFATAVRTYSIMPCTYQNHSQCGSDHFGAFCLFLVRFRQFKKIRWNIYSVKFLVKLGWYELNFNLWIAPLPFSDLTSLTSPHVAHFISKNFFSSFRKFDHIW